MRVLEKARRLFQDAGLACPAIPEELGAGLKKHSEWLFSTRELKMPPHNLQYYVHEAEFDPGE